jgi:hypothetical protein
MVMFLLPGDIRLLLSFSLGLSVRAASRLKVRRVLTQPRGSNTRGTTTSGLHNLGVEASTQSEAVAFCCTVREATSFSSATRKQRKEPPSLWVTRSAKSAHFSEGANRGCLRSIESFGRPAGARVCHACHGLVGRLGASTGVKSVDAGEHPYTA